MGSEGDILGTLPWIETEPGEALTLAAVVRSLPEADETTSRWFVGWGPSIPRTRWARFKLRMRVRRDRLRDALSVWRGEAEAVPWSNGDTVREQFERECG